MNPFLSALLIYSTLLIVLGLYLSRRTRSVSDFFVADRKLGRGLLFSTLLTANIGAGSTVGAAGLGYSLGMSGWWWVGSAAIGSLILAFTIGPRIYDLARRHHFLTLGDFLEFRYNRSIRAVIAGLLWGGTLSILAGQLIALAWILSVVAGTSKATGCLLGGLIVVTYFSAGGLKGTAWINVLQLVVKGFGFVLAVPLALAAVNGWEGLQQQFLSHSPSRRAFFSIDGIGVSEILGYVVLLAPSFIVSPGLLQKIFGARDRRVVRTGVATQGAVLLFYSFLPVLLGMCAAAVFPHLENEELALPAVMTQLLPVWLGVVFLASVFSAEVSSADAILFMLSTSLTNDLYKTYLRPGASGVQLLRMSRWVSVLSGGAGVGLAILLPSVVSALKIFYGLMSVSLFVPLFLGIYKQSVSANRCLAAILISVPVAVAVHLTTGGKGFGILSPVALGILLSLLVMISGGRRKERHSVPAFPPEP
ncbi:MAG: sodium:solute symporter family protein [Acidobacteriota bacterium]